MRPDEWPGCTRTRRSSSWWHRAREPTRRSSTGCTPSSRACWSMATCPRTPGRGSPGTGTNASGSGTRWPQVTRRRTPGAPGMSWTSSSARTTSCSCGRSCRQSRRAAGGGCPPGWCPRGASCELTDGDLEEIARAEHTRWYLRRLSAGWSAGGGQAAAATATRPPRSNPSVVPWPQLPPGRQVELRESLRGQLAQLEDVGYVAVVPSGGPEGAARFQRVGVVSAKKLNAPQSWTRRSHDDEEELHGDAGDWRVRDSFGDVRTVGNAEFRQSYAPLDGGSGVAWECSAHGARARPWSSGRRKAGRPLTRETGWLKGRSVSAGQSAMSSSGEPTGRAATRAPWPIPAPRRKTWRFFTGDHRSLRKPRPARRPGGRARQDT